MAPPEVCQEHSGVCARQDSFEKHFEEKIDQLISEFRLTAKGLWNRVNQHIDESPVARQKINEVDVRQRLFEKEINGKLAAIAAVEKTEDKTERKKERVTQFWLVFTATVIFSLVNIVLKLWKP